MLGSVLGVLLAFTNGPLESYTRKSGDLISERKKSTVRNVIPRIRRNVRNCGLCDSWGKSHISKFKNFVEWETRPPGEIARLSRIDPISLNNTYIRIMVLQTVSCPPEDIFYPNKAGGLPLIWAGLMSRRRHKGQATYMIYLSTRIFLHLFS